MLYLLAGALLYWGGDWLTQYVRNGYVDRGQGSVPQNRIFSGGVAGHRTLQFRFDAANIDWADRQQMTSVSGPPKAIDVGEVAR